MTTLEVTATGALATVQDLGRPGYAHLGVGRSGAADRRSLRLANRLVGNPESAAAVEAVLGGLALRADGPVTVAVTGAPCPLRADGRPLGMAAPHRLEAGATLELGAPTAGLRTYVAVRGGLDVPAVLGSRSTDTLSGLGPDPLEEGARLPVGHEEGEHPAVDVAPQPDPAAELVLGVRLGPRDDWFADGEVERFCKERWRVSSDADRVGVRLDGEPLRRRDDSDSAAELKSEAMLRGAVQVPRGGRPIVFGADHPVTGGYPVIAVVEDDDVDQVAQARPGQVVRFRSVD